MTGHIKHTIQQAITFKVLPRFRLPADFGSRLPRRVFTSTYFDTPERRLSQFGITLCRRVEHSKGTWHIQIPKGSAYLELEIPSSSYRPPQEFQHLFWAFFRKQDLILLGKLRTERTGQRVQSHEKKIADVTQDVMALLESRHVVRRFIELEVELLEGKKVELNQIRKILRHAGADDIPFRPKIFEALDLPSPLFPISVDSSAPTEEHLRTMLHNHVWQMMIHDPGTRLGQDPEDLHQMRVATRRVRALIRAGRPLLDPDWAKTIRQDMKWVGRLLGGVRDFDVLLDHLQHAASSLSTSEQGTFQPVLQKIQTHRSMARTELLNGLRSDRYLLLLERLENSLTNLPSRQSSVTLPGLARKDYNRLKTLVNQMDRTHMDTHLHDVRIHMKRVRYTAELAGPVLGKSVTRFLKQAKHLQDLLGSHQDAVIAETRLTELLRASRSARMAFVSGLIVARLRKQRSMVLDAFPGQWKKLEKRAKGLGKVTV